MRTSSNLIPPGPDSPASMPTRRKTTSRGAPNRSATRLDKMPASTSSAANMMVRLTVSSAAMTRDQPSAESMQPVGHWRPEDRPRIVHDAMVNSAPPIHSSAMDRIHPHHLLRRLDRHDIEIHHDRLLAGSHQNAFEDFIPAGVDFLVRHIRRHIDKIARACFCREFQLLAPSHPRPALDDEDDAFEIAMVVGAGLGVGVDRHSAGPKLFS